MKKILIVEDEQSIGDTVVHSVEREGYVAEWRMRGQEALELLRAGGYALAVLDVGLPDINGFELCKEIRKFSNVPVIFLTARSDEIDRIVGLEIGADDYVTKPFSPRELGARIKTVLRRAQTPADDVRAVEANHDENRSSAADASGAEASASASLSLAEPLVAQASSEGGKPAVNDKSLKIGPLAIDLDKLQAAWEGARLELTRYEFRLLALLARNPGRVYSRDELMAQVWGDDSPSLDRTVDAHIKSLRAKFRELSEEIDPILTHRGSGYALRDDL